MSTNNSKFDEIIGSLSNSPFYTQSEAGMVRSAVENAESMTWEDLRRQAAMADAIR